MSGWLVSGDLYESCFWGEGTVEEVWMEYYLGRGMYVLTFDGLLALGFVVVGVGLGRWSFGLVSALAV